MTRLDHLALHEHIRIAGGQCPTCATRSRRAACSCGGCASCRHSKRSREQEAAPQTRPFAAWGGWTSPVSLDLLLRATRPVPPHLQPFFRPGVNLYRVTVARPGGRRYLSIGMTQGRTQTIANRIQQHHTGRRGDRNVTAALNPPSGRIAASAIMVQAGRIPANMAPRTAHMYEIWLQRRERVSDWALIRDTRTFEEEALADLISGGN